MLDRTDISPLVALVVAFFISLGVFIGADEFCAANDNFTERFRNKTTNLFPKSDPQSLKTMMALAMVVTGGGFLGRLGWLVFFSS